MVHKTLRNPFIKTVIHNNMAVVCYDANILLMTFSFEFQRVFDTELALIVSIECLVFKLPTKKQRGVT